MAAPFQVNLTISAGVGFKQDFTITNPDMTPIDITGFKFLGNLAKHPTAIDAVTSTSGTPVYNYVSFDTDIENGPLGVYSIAMDAAKTSLLPEGKYVYSVVMVNNSGEKSPAVSGIAFVDVAFGALS